MPNQSGKIVLVFILLLLLLGAAVYLFLPGFKKREYIEKIPSSSVQTVEDEEVGKSPGLIKDYYSKNLKISFKVPENVSIKKKITTVIMDFPNGKIDLVFNGTNFESARDYYNELKKKNHLTPLSYQELSRGKYDYVITTDEDINDKSKTSKTYYIYIDNRVYPISTSDEALYPVLDQIVESFEYRP